MSLHILKLNENFWHPVIDFEKNFEIRKNDRGYQKGDYVQFLKVDSEGVPNENKDGHIISGTFQITYVMSGWGIESGYVVFGTKYLGDNAI